MLILEYIRLRWSSHLVMMKSNWLPKKVYEDHEKNGKRSNAKSNGPFNILVIKCFTVGEVFLP